MVDDVARHGKFLDITASGLHLVVHLSRAGWIRWRDTVPAAPPRPSNKSPIAARVVLDDDSGFDLTEAGTQKRLAIYVVRLARRGARASNGWDRTRSPTTSPPRSSNGSCGKPDGPS